MTDSDRLDITNYALEFLADLWSRFFRPVSIDKTIRTKNGYRVRVRVEDAEIAERDPAEERRRGERRGRVAEDDEEVRRYG